MFLKRLFSGQRREGERRSISHVPGGTGKDVIDRIISEGRGQNSWEIPNADETRNYFFILWRDEDQIPTNINIELRTRVGEGWHGIFRLAHNFTQPNADIIYLDAVAETGYFDTHTVEYENGFLKDDRTEMGGTSVSSGRATRESLLECDLFRKIDLPQIIDQEATIRVFLEQMLRGDFSKPQLVPPASILPQNPHS